MASPSSDDKLFELTQVSTSVSEQESLRFLEKHGFFYQGNTMVGELVDELYSAGRVRSKDAELAYFKPALRQDSRISAILDHYSIELPRFRFPWGTTPEGYYNWDIKSSPMAERGLIAYMLGSGSEWVCRDGSLELDENGTYEDNGTLLIPDHLLESYPKRNINMETGGILLVRPRAVQQAKAGRSIMLGLMRKEEKGESAEGV